MGVTKMTVVPIPLNFRITFIFLPCKIRRFPDGNCYQSDRIQSTVGPFSEQKREDRSFLPFSFFGIGK